MSHVGDQADQAAEFLQSRWKARPRFGIVLGTGSGQVAEQIDADERIDYGDIPHFPRSTAIGHAGQMVCGKLAGQEIIAMQGRFHLYEGYSVDAATLAIHVMHRMGVEVLFVSNAAGGMNPHFQVGEIMLINSHLDFLYRTSPALSSDVTSARPHQRSDHYDDDLIAQAKSFARQEGIVIHEGVYAALLGPNYETRAEYRFLRRIGADVAGMSTVPEVTVAARYGLRVMGMSVVTNVANPDSLDATTGQEVVDAAEVAASDMCRIVVNAIQRNH